MYALTASCTVAIQKAQKHYIQPCNFTCIQENPIKSGPFTLAGTFGTADGDAAPDASILSSNEHHTNDCGELVSVKALSGREHLACGPECTLTRVAR